MSFGGRRSYEQRRGSAGVSVAAAGIHTAGYWDGHHPGCPPGTVAVRLLFVSLAWDSSAAEDVRRIAGEQAALRRVATLVARGEPPEAVFASVAEEVGHIVPAADFALVSRYDAGRAVEVVGAWAKAGSRGLVGLRAPLDGRNVSTLVFERNQPVRADYVPGDHSGIVLAARLEGVRCCVGAPINVEGWPWGVMIVASACEGALPPDAEHRLAGFTELVATAIANAQARVDLRRFAEEQAALRRVATLVARATPPREVFAAVAEETGRLLDADITCTSRYDPDGWVTVVGLWAGTETARPSVGSRWRLGSRDVTTLVSQTGRPARVDDYGDVPDASADAAREFGFRSAVGVPISVEGHLWGVVSVVSMGEPPPADTEARLAGFTELLATTIANAEARAELRDFADEEAALRRVATLVARAASSEEVFAAVTAEAGRVLGTDLARMNRYDPDGAHTVVAGWTSTGDTMPVPLGTHWDAGGRNVAALVFLTGQPARIDDYADATGSGADLVRRWGLRSAVGVPVSVAGRLWGVMVVGSRVEPLPASTEARLAGFTELIATAIANAEAQAALTASRARIVAAADAARRRIERDLHDGAQQRLVSLALQIRATQAAAPAEAGEVVQRLESAVTEVAGALDELREIARGLHPAVLTRGGLRPALRALARRSAVPVDLTVRAERRLPEPVEIAAYYAVAEALTNTAKHAHASAAEVEVAADQIVLYVRVTDDGCGGAHFADGSGLAGLRDRVEALGGRIWLQSPPGSGTAVQITLPLEGPGGTGWPAG